MLVIVLKVPKETVNFFLNAIHPGCGISSVLLSSFLMRQYRILSRNGLKSGATTDLVMCSHQQSFSVPLPHGRSDHAINYEDVTMCIRYV